MKRILAAVLALAATPALAASTTDNLTVTANVTASCTIQTTQNLVFAYDPVGANRAVGADATGTATFEVICTNPSTTHTIRFGAGQHATASQRAMAQGTTPLNYSLYAGTTELTPTTDLNVTTTSAAQAVTVTIDGKVPGGQMVPSGTYTDTVVATVNM